MGLLTLALLSMMIIMILIGAFLRRNEYEDFDIRLPQNLLQPSHLAPATVNLYRLQSFFRHYPSTTVNRTSLDSMDHHFFLDADLYRQALRKFRSIHHERYLTRIDWSSIAEIIAILSTFVAHIFSIILTIAQVN